MISRCVIVNHDFGSSRLQQQSRCGKKLRVTQLGFEDSMDLLVVLTKVLGPSLGALETDASQISPALGEFAKQLNNASSTVASWANFDQIGGYWWTEAEI
ncbi:MAG: hypothetical protein JKY15_07100 [Deltaproteobacteria bacterium]|nr:hypothetical protein [Deltaproteobacteria bacterium]